MVYGGSFAEVPKEKESLQALSISGYDDDSYEEASFKDEKVNDQ